MGTAVHLPRHCCTSTSSAARDLPLTCLYLYVSHRPAPVPPTTTTIAPSVRRDKFHVRYGFRAIGPQVANASRDCCQGTLKRQLKIDENGRCRRRMTPASVRQPKTGMFADLIFDITRERTERAHEDAGWFLFVVISRRHPRSTIQTQPLACSRPLHSLPLRGISAGAPTDSGCKR